VELNEAEKANEHLHAKWYLLSNQIPRGSRCQTKYINLGLGDLFFFLALQRVAMYFKKHHYIFSLMGDLCYDNKNKPVGAIVFVFPMLFCKVTGSFLLSINHLNK